MNEAVPEISVVSEKDQAQAVVRKPMTVLVLGSGGMLGRDMVDVLVGRGHSVRSPLHVDFDITRPERIEQLRKQDFGMFDWIINCAAYTAVDKAESERMAAMNLNAVAPGMLGIAAQGCGARVLHFSTDFVFDGQSDSPYTEDSQPHPTSSYGSSKWLGEQNLMKEAPGSVICRTSWLFGPHGKSFPRTMIEAWRAGKELRVVDDQTGKPTYTKDLAELTADMVEQGVEAGIYHTAGPDVMTWWDLAVLAIETDVAASGGDVELVREKIEKVPTSAYPTPAKRPKYSVLSTEKIESKGFGAMRPMKEAVVEFVGRLRSAESESGE